jgi:hypothetical protein
LAHGRSRTCFLYFVALVAKSLHEERCVHRDVSCESFFSAR